MRFPARYRKPLAKARRLPLRLVTTASDTSGNNGVHAQALTLKR